MLVREPVGSTEHVIDLSLCILLGAARHAPWFAIVFDRLQFLRRYKLRKRPGKVLGCFFLRVDAGSNHNESCSCQEKASCFHFAILCFLKCGSTFSPNSRACAGRFSPHSSSRMCVHPAAWYSSIRSMHCLGVPAIAQVLSKMESVTNRAAALRPPLSIASAMGLISSKDRPAHSNRTSAEPRMF